MLCARSVGNPDLEHPTSSWTDSNTACIGEISEDINTTDQS